MIALNHRSLRSEEELERIAAELPVKRRWREQADDSLERVASAEPTPFESFERNASATEEEQVMTTLEALLSRLACNRCTIFHDISASNPVLSSMRQKEEKQGCSRLAASPRRSRGSI